MTRKEQKEARKIQIIQATLDLFVERGYYGTKTSQISRRAAVPLFSDEGTSVRRTGQDRSGRHAYTNADQRREWFGFFLSIYKNVVFAGGKKYFYCKNVCIYGECGAG